MSALHDCANLGDAGASPGWPRGTAGEWSTLCWEGTFEFTATSFQSSLSPSGTLTINGSLSVSALVNLCNPPGQNCIPTGVSFPVLDNAQWRYLAHFARTPEAGVDGLYRFENLTITVVPEPATVVLFLTGLGSLDLVQRLCRHAGGNRKHQRPVQTGLYSEDKWGRRELGISCREKSACRDRAMNSAYLQAIDSTFSVKPAGASGPPPFRIPTRTLSTSISGIVWSVRSAVEIDVAPHVPPMSP
jgi:hypothetical protein